MDKKKKFLIFGGIALVVVTVFIILLLLLSKSEYERSYNKVKKYLISQNYDCELVGDKASFCDAPNVEKETQYFDLYFDDKSFNLNYYVVANRFFKFIITKDSAVVEGYDSYKGTHCKYKIENDSNVILEKNSEEFDCERAIEQVENYYKDYINVYNNK